MSLSNRIRGKVRSEAADAWRNYVNGNRKDARETIRRHNGETSAMIAGEFVAIAHRAGRMADAVAFLDSFADF